MAKFTQLNLESIKSNFDAGEFQKGWNLFKQKSVFGLKHSDLKEDIETTYNIETTKKDSQEIAKVDISATIIESAGKRYQSNVTISEPISLEAVSNNLKIASTCECHIYRNCKHGAAIALQFFYEFGFKFTQSVDDQSRILDLQDKHLSSFKNWVAKYRESQQPPAPNSKNETVVYCLNLIDDNLIKVDVFATKTLKTGKFSTVGRKLAYMDSREPLSMYLQKPFFTDDDRDIIKMLCMTLRREASFMPSTFAGLMGKIGYDALVAMINTNRAFWNGISDSPLQWGKDKNLYEKWENAENDNLKLKFKVEGGGDYAITKPMVYIDKRNNTVGKLNATVDAKQLDFISTMRPIPKKFAEAFSKEMALCLPEIKPPTEVKVTKINSKPIPCVSVIGTLDSAGKMQNCSLKLSFQYDKHTISYFPENINPHLIIDGEMVNIERDKETENSAINHLKNLNLQAIQRNSSHENHLFFVTKFETSFMQALQIWKNFQEIESPKLTESGWKITFEKSYQLEFDMIDEWEGNIETQQNDWFSLSFDAEIDGKKIKLMPLIVEALKHYDLQNLPAELFLPRGNNTYIAIPSSLIKPTIEILYELFDSGFTTTETSVKLRRHDAHRLESLDQLGAIQWRGGNEFRDLGKKLKDFKGIKPVTPPVSFHANLRDYQQLGLNWLQFLREYEFNGILADDMGLGKTIQTLAHLLLEKQNNRSTLPSILVAPTSLMSNWKNEAKKFAPDLKVLVLHGSDRSQHYEALDNYDLILTTYPLLVRDEEILLGKKFYYLILDEAQAVKNAKTLAAKVLRKISAKHKLCLTGTPMENHLGELWSIFDFLMPGFLGPNLKFTQDYRTPIEKQGNSIRRKQLANRVSPFMLRRTKNEVALELPSKTEIIRTVQFDKGQAALYESIRLSMEQKVRQEINAKGLGRSHIMILDAILKLRQTCCDPRLLKLTNAKSIQESAKLELLMDMVPELIAEGRRILLFSQFTSMLALIEIALTEQNIAYTKLTGETQNRGQVIDDFKSGKANIFLISLKAGGVGLNLTEADTVIHYDPWWNPAVENQATDRVYRIGQDKPVFVYKLIVENTLEEKILEMQQRKKAITSSVYKDESGEQTLALTAKDIEDLFAPIEKVPDQISV